jgi:hypothetical protein
MDAPTPPPSNMNDQPPHGAVVDGLAMVGLSLTRRSAHGHPASSTHQTAFDLNRLTDRSYRYVASTSDDGWLVGGGEPMHSPKLPAADSAHVALMHVSTWDPSTGGVSQEALLQALIQCQILIPQLTVVPTSVVVTDRGTLQVRFDMESAYHEDDEDNVVNDDLDNDPANKNHKPTRSATEPPPLPALPVNWQLRFIHNQLVRHFLRQQPSWRSPHHHRCTEQDGGFYCALAHDVTFRSPAARTAYLDHCHGIIAAWRQQDPGPRPLEPLLTRNVVQITSPTRQVRGGTVGSSDSSSRCRSGVWLFRNRQTPTHVVAPNFLPPYHDPAKRAIIFDVLSEQWDDRVDGGVWRPAPPLPKPDYWIIAAKAAARQRQRSANGAAAAALTTSGAVRKDHDEKNDKEIEVAAVPWASAWACGAVEPWSFLSSPSVSWCTTVTTKGS